MSCSGCSQLLSNLWIFGVILILTGSIMANMGTNLVSYDHKEQREKTQRDSQKISIQLDKIELGIPNIGTTSTKSSPSLQPQPKSSSRRLGTAIFVIGNLTIFASFGFAAQSLLASLESIQFISNIFFAKYLHGEAIKYRMIAATSSIIIGNVLVLIFATHDDTLYTSEQIIDLYLNNSAYHIYLIFAGLSFFLCHITFMKYYEARIVLNVPLWQQDFIEPFSFSVSSSLVGTQAVLNAKCMSMFIQLSILGKSNEFMKPTLWVILGVWIVLVIYWLKRVDLGLELFSPMFIIPVLQVFYMFFAIVCGGIFFQELDAFNAGQWIGFSLGVFMILAGVYALAPTNSKNSVSAEMMAPVVLQLEEFPEALGSFRKLFIHRVHPVTDLLLQETLKHDVEDCKLCPALAHFRRMSCTAQRENGDFELESVELEMDMRRGLISLGTADTSDESTISEDVLNESFVSPIKIKTSCYCTFEAGAVQA